jgi:dephospho-CoA kinase
MAVIHPEGLSLLGRREFHTMKLLGLTGGVGMGKSTAAQFLALDGIPVADTDQIARDLVQPGEPALDEIRLAFGPSIIGPEGNLLRHELARIVFTNEAARRRLEQILHPRIRTVWKAQADQWRTEGQSCAVVIIPLLFETNAATEFDAILCVACSASVQRARLAQRGWTDAQIEQRQQAQLPVRTKMELSDHVLWNDAGTDLLRDQLRRVVSLLGCQRSVDQKRQPVITPST